MKGLTHIGVVRLCERGYKIKPIPSQKDAKYFELLKNGKNILEIHFDEIKGKVIDLDQEGGTILTKEGKCFFKKLIGMYITDEGVVLEYEHKDGKKRIIKECEDSWII